MIKSIEFIRFRNLNRRYKFNGSLNALFGKNNSGKSNFLDGIRLAFASITGDYFRIRKSDFFDSDDSLPLQIKVELEPGIIPSLDYFDVDLDKKCGFVITVKKSQNGRYTREISLLNGSPVDGEILRNDINIPSLYMIPLVRIEDIYSDGLITGISKFIGSEERYKDLVKDSNKSIKLEIDEKRKEFQEFCRRFNQELDIELSEPRFTDEKVYIVSGEKEHNYIIGSGYKSIANIILNTLNDDYSIILIDEIENHLHPALIRTLLRELRIVPNTMVIGTTHSAVVINELKLDELLDIEGHDMFDITEVNKRKLNTFMHSGRSELMLADNVILVEGYTEELLLKHYLYKNNYNWTVVNVAGIMFEPYIELACLLNKRIIVITDNDRSLSLDGKQPSSRFKKLEELCANRGVSIIEIDNTLETDLYNNGFIKDEDGFLKSHSEHSNIKIAKKNKKTTIAEFLISKDIDFSCWHVISEIEHELKGY